MEIRDLDQDDLDAALDVRNRSFGVLPEANQQGWRQMMRRALDDTRVLGGYRGTQLVAVARINRFRQWWRGRAIPMAGIAGVVVAPEERGRGTGRALMRATLERAASHGFPLSALYPATLPVYRQCGWEIAGSQYLVDVPAEALRGLAGGDVPVRRVGADDVEEILAVVRGIHTTSRSSGPIDWEAAEARHWLTEDRPFSYLADDGFLAYHWEGRDLEVDELVAGSGETARALWSLVGSGSSIAKTVRACVGPTDPLHWLTREEVVRQYDQKHWMLRLVDVPAALSGRGYPAGLEAELTFQLDDPQLPANSGSWRLSIAKGTGRAERTRGGDLRLGPRGLAALYAGTPMTSLRAVGLAAGGDPETDGLYDTAFTGQPYLLDYF